MVRNVNIEFTCLSDPPRLGTGEVGEVKELEVLLQAANEGSEDIQLERSLRTIMSIDVKSLGISDS